MKGYQIKCVDVYPDPDDWCGSSTITDIWIHKNKVYLNKDKCEHDLEELKKGDCTSFHGLTSCGHIKYELITIDIEE